MFADMEAFDAHLRPPLGRATQVGSSRPPPSTPLARRQQQATVGTSRARERAVARIKERDLLRTLARRVLTQLSLVASWKPPELRLGLRRIANVGVGRLSPLLNSLTWRGHTPDLDIMATIRQLPPYLQPVVTLMVNMVPPNEESKIREKRGKEALTQSTSMIMVVSIISLL